MRESRWRRKRSIYVPLSPEEAEDQARRRAIFLEVVENQLRENNPPETRATLQRLMAAGKDRDEAMRLIGCALAAEMYEILQHKSEFDQARYVRYLHGLPAMPWEE